MSIDDLAYFILSLWDRIEWAQSVLSNGDEEIEAFLDRCVEELEVLDRFFCIPTCRGGMQDDGSCCPGCVARHRG